MKRFLSLLLALSLTILCGCTGSDAPSTSSVPSQTTPSTTQPTIPPSTTPTTAPSETTPAPTETMTVPTQTEPAPTVTEPEPTQTEPVPTETEPVVLYRNPLTGEALAEYSENRPYAIVLNNIQAAQPQHGVSKADVLFEILAEGGITRCLGIYYDITDVTTFGSIRSARPYLVHLAQGFDAIFVHAGASPEADAYLDTSGWNHLDGVDGTNASKYFYRDKDRLSAGYSLEHTMFIKPSSILSYAKKLGYPTTRKGGLDYGWNFGDSSALSGTDAKQMTVYFGSNSKSKSTVFSYNAATGLYGASQYGAAYTDGADGQQVAFRNVLVLKTSVVNQGDAAGHLTINTVGSGTGYYACDGKRIAIKWSRISKTSPFVFTTEDGEPLTLAVGKTYIGIVPNKGLVVFS